jgi:transcriptional regulator of acetoin/glycerol metabolism
LENAIEYAFTLCPLDVIGAECLPPSFRSLPAASASPGARLRLKEIEEAAIREALRRNGGSRVAAARELGICKTTLWRKMRRMPTISSGGFRRD